MTVAQDVDWGTLERQVFRLTEGLRRRFARHLAQHGLTPPQFMVLCALDRSAGYSSRIGDLAAAAFQSAPAMTGIVDRLVERGLVQRTRDPQDRRSVMVALTEEGKQLVHRIREERRQDIVRLLQQLSAGDRVQLATILEKLLQEVEK